VHNEWDDKGRCVPCLQARYQRYQEKQRATKPQSWPCTQCGCPIVRAPRTNPRKAICNECAPDDRFRSFVRRYGVDKAMFEAMYFDQDGKCAIASCQREAACIDHDHATGRVRGLLCQGCNVTIGFMEWPGWVAGARAYLVDTLPADRQKEGARG
jgi:hypothetical protein